ncbi:MAG: shikimate kinase [Dehalococcoidia bacterium]|nr:shikimate kinase [Dehalococcoidia bacterium]
MSQAPRPSPIGRRIHITGNTSAGKSTLGMRLASALDAPFVELDALNWLPGWVALQNTDPEAFRRRIAEATAGDAWVVAGSYMTVSQPIFWDRLEAVVWLDLPLSQILRRTVTRSWRRWRAKELLWGTNTESFTKHLKVWSQDSLIWWAITQHHKKRRNLLAWQVDPRWSHIRFIRLRSSAEVEAFVQAVERAVHG